MGLDGSCRVGGSLDIGGFPHITIPSGGGAELRPIGDTDRTNGESHRHPPGGKLACI
jgi:hypothetical protein